MEPDNREIFAALVQLLDRLAAVEIERAISATNLRSGRPHPLFIHSQQGAKADALNALRVMWDNEQMRNQRKAIESLIAIAKQRVEDGGEEQLQAVLRQNRLQFIDDQFVRLGVETEEGSGHQEPSSGDLDFTPDAAQLTLSTVPPTVSVKQVRARLDAVLTHQNRLSDRDAVPVSKVRVKHEISRTGLLQLQETLGGFHGFDVPETEEPQNTQEVPLTEDDLKLLRVVVTAAIQLHEAPNITSQIQGVLKNLCDILGDLKELIDKLAAKFDSLQVLAVKIGTAYLAFRELLDILGGS